jgi:beta-xylosidase
MRALNLFLLLILFSMSILAQPSTTSQRSGNPLFKGWYADPEGTIFNKQYWIYPTYSDVYEKQVFMDCFSSSDLINWKKHEHIIDTSSIKWAHKAMWAPAIIEKDGKYFLFFAANDIQSNNEPGGIGVAVSDRPEGPYKDLLGKPLISSFKNGAQPIDQFVFRDENGKYYMIYGGWKHCNIVQLKDDFSGLIAYPDGSMYKEITPQGYVEGPFMFKKNGKYYFMWSEGGWTGPDYTVAYAISDTPFGPFKRIGKILQQDPSIATGAGHHSVIQANDQWYIIYHRRPKGETAANHRETCIEEMSFAPDGTINPVKITKEGVEPNKLTD